MRQGLLVFVVLILGSMDAQAIQGAGEIALGNKFYRLKKYQEALEQYKKADEKNPQDSRIAYDLAAAAYKTAEYDRAVQYFQKSLLTDDDLFRQDVQYNLGNALYKSGILREDKDVAGALKQLQASLESFQKAHAMAPDDQDVINNHAFVKKELERLQKKQQQQSRQCPTSNQKKDGQQHQGQSQAQGQDQGQQQAEEKQGQDLSAQEKESSDQKPQQGSQHLSAEASDKGYSMEDVQEKINDFERNELPQGLLNLMSTDRQQQPVAKDW